MTLKLLLLFGLVVFSGMASAYPNFITFGYQSCLACHYNPAGGGPLTDYGRVVAATLISDRLFWLDGKSEEELADQSSFLFSKAPSAPWRPQVDFRELWMQTDTGHADQKSQFITMEATAAMVAQFMDEKLTLAADIGFAPTPLAEQDSSKSYKNYRSREHYIGYRFSKEVGVYAGLMDKSFGIRVPDHEAFSRTETYQNQDDQTYGVLAHWLSGNWEVQLQPFIGNFVQSADLRQRGATTVVGYSVDETARLEASVLRSFSNYLDLFMYSVDTRLGVGRGNSLMLEIGQVKHAYKALGDSTSMYFFMQDEFLLTRGFFAFLTVEMLQPDLLDSSQTFRFGPGLQYFMNQRVEWRADIYNGRSFQASSYSADNWTMTAQLHLWF